MIKRYLLVLASLVLLTCASTNAADAANRRALYSYSNVVGAASARGGQNDGGVVAQANGVVDTFFWGTNGHLWHERYTPGQSWSGPVDMGGSLASDPSPTVSSSGTVDVFWKGTDGNLWHDFIQPGTGWSGPQSLGMGALGSGPHAVGQPNGTIDVFWTGSDASRSLFHAWYNTGVPWAGAENLSQATLEGESMASDPSPTVSSTGIVDVFWKGTDGNLWHKWFQQYTNWWGPQSLGMGPLGSGPHAVGQPNGTIDVFWVGSGSPSLWHGWYHAGEPWAGPIGMLGSLASDPSPTISSLGTVDVFWKGTDGNLWHNFFQGSLQVLPRWSGPQTLGMGQLGSGPHAAGQSSGIIDVFWAGSGTSPSLWHAWSNGGPWAGPMYMGGQLASF